MIGSYEQYGWSGVHPKGQLNVNAAAATSVPSHVEHIFPIYVIHDANHASLFRDQSDQKVYTICYSVDNDGGHYLAQRTHVPFGCTVA